MVRRARCQHQRNAERRKDSPHGVQRLGVRVIVGDQRDRGAVTRYLARRLQQARGKARVETGEAGGRSPALVRDAPVPGCRVMHGVVKTRRRDLPCRGGKRFEHVVHVVAIAAR